MNVIMLLLLEYLDHRQRMPAKYMHVYILGGHSYLKHTHKHLGRPFILSQIYPFQQK